MPAAPVIALVLAGTAALLWLGREAKAWAGDDAVAMHLRYQPRALLVAVAVVAAVQGLRWVTGRAVTPLAFLEVGELQAVAVGLGPFGEPGERWLEVGARFALIATAATASVVWLQARPRPPTRALLPALPLALLAAVANAAAEELLFRVALVQGLHERLPATTVAVISGVLFGVPHYVGSPGRLPGVVMAGFLGWLLCTATLQVGGVAWAWALHALQDLAIFTILFAQARSVPVAGRLAQPEPPPELPGRLP